MENVTVKVPNLLQKFEIIKYYTTNKKSLRKVQGRRDKNDGRNNEHISKESVGSSFRLVWSQDEAELRNLMQTEFKKKKTRGFSNH